MGVRHCFSEVRCVYIYIFAGVVGGVGFIYLLALCGGVGFIYLLALYGG